VTEEWETARENLETLRATAKLLEDAKTALSTRYLGGMQESFSKYLTLLDGEDTKQAVLDVSFDVSVREGGKSRALESFSRGSKDVLQFCARLSLAKALFSEGEEPFLLLDDPFVNLDEAHLTEARAMLNRLASQLQILYLVCHDSRA
jgi:DNA repair exonuclease SbcCD ATPase subunit